MGEPQLEDGFARIANELLEAICAFDFTKREYKILIALLRQTYGFNKKTDKVSQWRLAEMTGLSRANVSRTLAELIGKQVVSVGDAYRESHGQKIPEIGINKRYTEWRNTVAKSATVSPSAQAVGPDPAAIPTDAESATVAKSAPVPNQQPLPIQHRCQNGNTTVAKLATRPLPKQQPHKDIQKTTQKTKETRAGREGHKSELSIADLVAEGVEKQHAIDWLAVRKVRKAGPLTATAWKGLVREAGKAGLSVDSAVQICAERGWQSLKAEWIRGRDTGGLSLARGSSLSHRGQQTAENLSAWMEETS